MWPSRGLRGRPFFDHLFLRVTSWSCHQGSNVRRAELLAVLSLGADLGLGAADGAHPPRVPDRDAPGRAHRPGRDGARHRLLRRAPHVGGLPRRRLRAGEVVRGRPRPQGRLPPRRPARDRLRAEAPRGGTPVPRPRPDRRRLPRATAGAPPTASWTTTAGPPKDSRRSSGWARTCRTASGRPSSAGTARARPGEAKGEAISVASRLVSLADVVEVFHRLGGVPAAISVARERSGTQFDPALVDCLLSRRGGAVRRPRVGDDLGRRDPRPSPSSRSSCPTRSSTPRSRRSRTSPTSSRPTPSGTRAPSRSSRRRRPGSRGSPTPMRRWFAAPGSCTTSVGSASRTRSGTSRASSRRPNSSACACTRT